MAFLVGAVLWPFVSVYLRETTLVLCRRIPVDPGDPDSYGGDHLIIWFYSPEHARKDLDQIAV